MRSRFLACHRPAALAALLCAAGAASAATLTVTTTSDADAADGGCSLRQAGTAAKATALGDAANIVSSFPRQDDVGRVRFSIWPVSAMSHAFANCGRASHAIPTNEGHARRDVLSGCWPRWALRSW